MKHLSTTEMLAAVMELELPAKLKCHELPKGTFCTVTGVPITEGYAVMDVTTPATTEFLDCFKGQVTGFVSVSTARCFKSAAPSKKYLVKGKPVANPTAKSHFAVQVEDEVLYQSPVFDPVTAVVNETVSWSACAREAWEKHRGRHVFIVITPDFKRRLWPYARTSILSESTFVYILNKDYNLDGTFCVNWGQLIEFLDIAEEVYRIGFSKKSMLQTLFTTPVSVLQKIGVNYTEEKAKEETKERYQMRCQIAAQIRASELEKTLKPIRSSIEFQIAVMFATKDLTEKEKEKAIAAKLKARSAHKK